MNDLQKELEKLFPVPFEAAAEYERRHELLIGEVDRLMSERRDIGELLGNNSLEVMKENHRNHARFMSNVFTLNQFQVFLNTVPWVYRTYRARGFSFAYFPAAFQAWLTALEKYLEPHLARPLGDLYRWLLDRHERLIQLSQFVPEPPFEVEERWEDVLESFMQALLKGEHKSCLRLADKNVNTREELEGFYLQVLQPAMYNIGDLWEKGELSVAHEHLSSAIVSRVMANLYPRFILVEHTKGKAIVTASPNEYHEIGARMVADFLEIDGWDVRYLGANMPQEELFKMLKDDPPQLLGISVTMPFNIDHARSIVETVKRTEELQMMKTLVGGKTFLENSFLWEVTGADGCALNGRDAVKIASRLLEDDQDGC